MLTIGITGGIGSGKTYVANLFQKHNIPCYSSDLRAKFLMNNNSQIKNALISELGRNAYLNDEINRPFIAEAIFNDKEKLAWMNSIIHPIVANDFEIWKDEQINSPYVLKEAAILIESGAYKTCDKIIVVSAPLDLRVKRVKKRDNLSDTQVKDRINNQISDKERLKYANFTIINNGIENVKEQIEKIHITLIDIIQ